MSDQVCQWKRKWKQKGDEAMPRWLDPTVWEGLVKFWLEPKSEATSINSRNARYSDPDGTRIHKHRSGQTYFKARARKHYEKTGDPLPDFLLVLEETHRELDGSFVDGMSEKIYHQVSSRIAEAESLLLSWDNVESSASGGLSLTAKNQIYAEVAPKKTNRIYGVGNLQAEASSDHIGQPPPPTEDPHDLAAKLAAAKATLATQATQLQKMHSYDVYFDYLAEKDPEFAARFRREDPAAGEATGGEATGGQAN